MNLHTGLMGLTRHPGQCCTYMGTNYLGQDDPGPDLNLDCRLEQQWLLSIYGKLGDVHHEHGVSVVADQQPASEAGAGDSSRGGAY